MLPLVDGLQQTTLTEEGNVKKYEEEETRSCDAKDRLVEIRSDSSSNTDKYPDYANIEMSDGKEEDSKENKCDVKEREKICKISDKNGKDNLHCNALPDDENDNCLIAEHDENKNTKQTEDRNKEEVFSNQVHNNVTVEIVDEVKWQDGRVTNNPVINTSHALKENTENISEVHGMENVNKTISSFIVEGNYDEELHNWHSMNIVNDEKEKNINHNNLATEYSTNGIMKRKSQIEQNKEAFSNIMEYNEKRENNVTVITVLEKNEKSLPLPVIRNGPSSKDLIDNVNGTGNIELADTQQSDSNYQLPQYIAALVANFGSLINGMCYGWPSVAQSWLQSQTQPVGEVPLSDEEISWLSATLLLSSAVALPFWTLFFSTHSKKFCGYVIGVVFLAHWLLLALCKSFVGIMAARSVCGIATAGMFIFTAPYIREISEDSIRGTLGSLVSVLFNAGVLLQYLVGWVLSYQDLNYIGIALCVLYLAAFWRMPETPTYLVTHGRIVEATESLQWLRGAKADVHSEVEALRETVARRKEEEGASVKDFVKDAATVKGLVISFILCANQPLCGFFVVLSYSVNMFAEAGTDIAPNLAAVIVGLLLLLGSVLSNRLVDRLGRRVLFMISDLSMAVCLAALGVHSYLKDTGTDVSSLGWIPVTSLSIFMAMVSLAVTTLPFVVITEIFLPQAQSIAILSGGCVILILGFVANKFFTVITHSLGLYGCYWLFSGFCWLIALYIYMALPETKGRTLESIRNDFGKRKDNNEL